MAPEDVLPEFLRYVQNDIPLRLIFIPDMSLVDRGAVQEYFQPFIEGITEDSINKILTSPIDRESAISQLVKETVRYAILSHRWLAKGEPTFNEMMNGKASGLGRQKLWKFCEVAKGGGLKFAWSDTCCIDKSSSSELDEAIRSMFRWYKNASICIVYLGQTKSLVNLQSDEWFKRGWTLQELLAPAVVKFFNLDWQPLTDITNDKSNENILQLLSEATGCSKGDLRNFRPGPSNVDDRMTWVARRRTTRAEDIAYSMMGIFDVSLQTAYGEGAERAFCRLIESIMQSNGNTSVLNWAGKPAASHGSRALPSSPACYVGHCHFYSARKLDLAMTSRGLRIPLVILPVKLIRFSRLSDYVVQADFSLDAQLGKETNIITIQILERTTMKDSLWALGVFNYMPPYGNQVTGHPALRQVSTAYLLARRKTQPPTQSSEWKIPEGFKVKDDLRYYGWRKISTMTFIHFTLDEVNRTEVMIVNKDRLETVYL